MRNITELLLLALHHIGHAGHHGVELSVIYHPIPIQVHLLDEGLRKKYENRSYCEFSFLTDLVILVDLVNLVILVNLTILVKLVILTKLVNLMILVKLVKSFLMFRSKHMFPSFVLLNFFSKNICVHF